MRSRSIIICSVMAVLGAFAILAASAAWATTLREEVDLGRKLDEQILKDTPQIRDKQALDEINEIGSRLVKNVNRPEIEYHFRIIKDSDLNAFAVPGGYVYFTDHLWNVLRTDERIGVLAHEIIHVDRRHVIDAISKQQKRQIWLAVLLTAVRANQTWGDITGVLHNIYSLKYSRDDERQADELGTELAYKAGYNPAGLLLAMRKINRFQSESGGQPPKIFSGHPPTPERMQYLAAILTKLNVPIPPDKPIQEHAKYRIGDVVSVADNRVQFASTESLRRGDVVWLMKSGWDYYYEKKTTVPVARAIVLDTGRTYYADITLLPKASRNDIVKGLGVYSPPAPKPEHAAFRLEAGSPTRLATTRHLARLQRFLARSVVWNKDASELVYDTIGAVVVIDPATETFVAVSRPDYEYAPLSAGADLVPFNDPAAARWMGPIVSVGRGGETIELATERDRAKLAAYVDSATRFDVLYPAWDSEDSYKDRVVGKAVLKSLDKKIVLQMLSYSPGWDIKSVQPGFDIYEHVEKETK